MRSQDGFEVVNRLVREEPERVQRLNDIGDTMRAGYKRLGFNTGNSVTPIIPIIIGDRMRTLMVWHVLFDAGVFVNPVLTPAVPQGMDLLRTSYMATHTDQQLDQVLGIFHEVGKHIGVI